MKKIIVTSVSALVLITSSAFAGTVRQLADCGLAQPAADNDLSVTLSETFAARVGVKNQSVITATVTQETIAGSELVGVYTVQFVAPRAGILGSEGSYVGEGFDMSIPLTPANPKAHASISIVGNQPEAMGVKMNEQLLCTFN